MTRVGFIGTGAITAAMVRGIRASAALRDWPVLLSPRNAETAAALAGAYAGVSVGLSNQDVADRSDLLILAVRPQIAHEALPAMALRADHRVISLIAGLDHGQIARWTGAVRVCRAIPLPFVARGSDATPVYPPDPEALSLFGALGQALPVATQRDFDVFGALSALMASFFGIAEIASDWGAARGLAPDQATAYVGQLFGNLGEVLRQDPLAVERLRADHSTRGGLNEQLFAEFRALGGEAALRAGLDGILRRVAPERG